MRTDREGRHLIRGLQGCDTV